MLAAKGSLAMRQQVTVSFTPQQRYTLLLPAAGAGLAADEARRWLDDAFVANDCEPLRASGKVLIADKVLVLAGTVGPARFANDADWAAAFARAALAALGRPVVQVDVAAGTISY
jgi:hypothetical protein